MGLGAALLGITSFRFFNTSFESAAISLIKDQLHFLRLDEEGLRKFATAFSESKKNDAYRFAIRGYSFLGIDSSQSGKVNQLVTSYLLSSDFFRNGMDESRVVKFVALYNPYTSPCAHPFSHVYFS
jgi:hypothetical protein